MAEVLIGWDSSVLIDWIKGDTVPRDRILSIREVVEEVQRGTCRLGVSTLVYPEVLETRMPSGAIETFRGFMQNKKEVEILAVDIRVAEKAQEIRNRCSTTRKIKTPDAVHIATAIISGAKAFHTFDKGLLSWDGKDEVDRLSITTCHTQGTQSSIF